MNVTLLPAVEQLSLLRRGAISPLELAEEHIQRIEQLNPVINALVDFDADRVREQARSQRTGALAGLPLTIKSSIEVRGHRCEIGSLLRKGIAATADAEAVGRLRAAGATLLGTTNCPEFLMAYETDNSLSGRTRNPWALDRTPGGSSGGEAAAIAAGLSAGGLGSDSGGSVRIPAHFTGICALKPTPGRVPGRGHQPPCVGPFSTLGAVGPMARTVGDVRLLFAVLCGRDELDPISPPVAESICSEEALRRIPIGWFEDDGLTPVTPETAQAVRDAAAALERQGFLLRRFRPASLEAARKLWHTFFVQCGAMFYQPVIQEREEQLSPVFRDFLHSARSLPPLSTTALLDAWAQLDQVRGQLLAEMRDCPVLLCPACSIPAFRHGERTWLVEGQPVQYLDVMRYTQWFNLLGAPAAVVPVAQTAEGLPVGVQIAGRPFEDERVLAVAAAVERELGVFPAPQLAALLP